MKGIGRQSFLVVFDFDHTVVDCNTDEVIPAALGRGPLQQDLMAAKDRLQWTKLMDTLCAPYTEKELRQAAHDSVVMDEGMPAVFQYLVQAKQQCENKTAEGPVPHGGTIGGREVASLREGVPAFLEINIASDANLLFIDAALEARLPFVKPHVSQIHSNPYYNLEEAGPEAGRGVCYDAAARPTWGINEDDEAQRDAAHNANQPARKSRVCWYEPHGHTCACCLARGKPNMCKSRIIQRLLETTSLIDPTIIFIGDGANDYCPILNLLRPRDFMFARRGFPIHKILSSPVGEAGGCCRIGLWKDAEELLCLFRAALEHPQARLPSLVRFRDAGAKEFRSVTMNQRIPSVLRRTLEENVKDAGLCSDAGRALVEKLVEEARQNGFVPPLPGQSQVPAWLRNYAYVTEYDSFSADPVRRVSVAASSGAVTPRWGQVPWLHGEIYFYHLLWQYLLVTDADTTAGATVEGRAQNVISPYGIANPLYSQECGVCGTDGQVVEPVMPQQVVKDAAPLSVAEASVASPGIVVQRRGSGEHLRAVPYESLLPPAQDGWVPPRDTCFGPYRDIFAREKHDVLMNFVQLRVVPMLACAPWGAAADFVGVLVRWMLWGNGLDLSMFTLEQLSASHGTGAGHDAGDKEDGEAAVQRLREKERAAAFAQDDHLAGNEAAAVEALLQKLATRPVEAGVPTRIDIVNDNVGVELIADLCLGLWYAEQREPGCTATERDSAVSEGKAREGPLVQYHVKSMPYYVSDVTPRDLDITLHQLESLYKNEAGGSATVTGDSAASRAALQSVLEPFVVRVRAAFARGVFAVDADTVWTQPNEMRDLPPRVVNRYFFTQQISDSDAKMSKGGYEALPAGAAALYTLNKSVVTPRTGLVLFKGDLNYRRLVGDRYWDRSDFLVSLSQDATHGRDLATPTEGRYTEEQRTVVEELVQDTPDHAMMAGQSFQDVISAYWPTATVPLCSVRTIKSECCVGVPGSVKSKLDAEKGLGWRLSGKYGEILLAN